MVQVNIPHNFLNPTPYQIDYLGSDKQFSVLVWHRRARKSRTALSKQLIRIFKRPKANPGVCYYALPTFRQAKAVMWDTLVNDHIPREVIAKKNDSELAIHYKNGVIQRFIGTEDPDRHRGTNPFDVVFDEYSEMRESIWTAIFQPVLMENKGTATFVYTPKGKNHSWKLLQLALQNPMWFTSIKNVNDTNVFTAEELAEIQRNTPQALYAQEYLCEFLEGAGQFFRRIRENTYSPDNVNLTTDGDFNLGVDLAKYQDWTVLTPFNLNTFHAYPQDRFNQVDWNLQEARIEASALRHNNALINVDSTGVGDPIAENLIQRDLTVEPFRFTEQSRTNLLNNLAMRLEQDEIKIPNDAGLIGELEAFRYELSERGKVKIGVPEGMTDDRVMSLALAVWKAVKTAPEDGVVDEDVDVIFPDIGV